VFSLTPEDQLRIRVTIKVGKSAREINRAHCLNQREKGRTIIEIAENLEMTPRTVINICSAYEEQGLEAALKDEPRSGRPEEHDARVISYVVATVCSDPPDGFDRWTLDLLKERVEADKVIESISRQSIWLILQEHDLKPWQQKMWCVPNLNEEYIERMEAVLDVYELPHNTEVPVVCVDEKPVVLHADTRPPISMSDGQAKRVDYEYKRCGTANVFCGVEPKVGLYFNKVTHTRKAPEFAQFLAEIAAHYSGAKKIILVMDNLSTHKKKSLTEFFGEENGEKLWSRFHVMYTPKHASWLNQAEIAIGMYQRQCIGGSRIPDIPNLEKKTIFWNRAVNAKKATINWSFTKLDAREKFDYM
jgi:transposase